MQNTIRTTITFPEDTYINLKHLAINQKQSLSDLVVTTLNRVISHPNAKPKKPAILNFAGNLHDAYRQNPIDLDNFRDETDWSNL